MSDVKTSCPRDRSSFLRLVPMNPAPPVIRILAMSPVLLEDIRNSACSRPVSVRVLRATHARVFCFIVEQTLNRVDDSPSIRPDEPRNSGFDRFRALGGVAHHQHGLSQRWRFLLYSAGVRENQAGTIEQ